ncbi:hypothetical protein LCGC14_2591000, partial [marine sediment metagenome]
LITLPLLGKVIPRNSLEIEGNPWGIQAGSLDEEVLEKAGAIGVKWTRLGASWPKIEKTKGVYDWSATDKAFNAALKYGITPFVILGGSNGLYTKTYPHEDRQKAELYGERPAPPTYNPVAMKAWSEFVEAAVLRYKDRIKYWEIWNEPDHHAYWGKGPDAKDYGKLVEVTATLIKKLDPEAKVIVGATAGILPEWTGEYLEMGFADKIDIISYHQYGGEPEERFPKTLELRKVIDKYNPDIETWQGECGYPSHSSSRDYRGISPWGLNIQSKWLLRQAFTDVFFCKATLSNYFKLVHTGKRGELQERSMLSAIDSILGFPERGGSRVRTKGVNEKCLLTNPDLEPKPAYFTYQNLCSAMDDRYSITDVDHTIQVLDQGMFYGIGIEDDAFPSVPLVAGFVTAEGHNLIAYWLPWHPQEYTPDPAIINLELRDCSFEKPVRIDLLTGKVYKLEEFESSNGNTVFSNIP